MAKEYWAIKIPAAFKEKIDKIIKKHPDFVSRSDVVKYAIRILYKELVGFKKKK